MTNPTDFDPYSKAFEEAFWQVFGAARRKPRGTSAVPTRVAGGPAGTTENPAPPISTEAPAEHHG